MVEITLRPAAEADAPAIRELIHRVGINPTGLDWRHFVLAVDSGGRMLGCGQLKPHGPGVIELASLAVLPEYERQGIGGALIKHLMAAGPRPLYLMCRSGLGPLYEKHGFRGLARDELPRYFRRMAELAGLAAALGRLDETLLVMKLK